MFQDIESTGINITKMQKGDGWILVSYFLYEIPSDSIMEPAKINHEGIFVIGWMERCQIFNSQHSCQRQVELNS